MPVEIANRTRSRIDIKRATLTVEALLKHYRLTRKTVSVVFIGDRLMSRLNLQWRRRNKPTDILSFGGEGDFLGELLIDWQQIKRQAPKWGNTAAREMVFILVHGFLHLLGHDDQTDRQAEAMRKLGESLIGKLKL